MAAGVGAQLFASFPEAATKMVRVKEKFYPRPEFSAVYNKKYERYCQAIDALKSFWNVC
jgi:ribulose kinase